MIHASTALLQVPMIDLVLAGDNAVTVGLAACRRNSAQGHRLRHDRRGDPADRLCAMEDGQDDFGSPAGGEIQASAFAIRALAAHLIGLYR